MVEEPKDLQFELRKSYNKFGGGEKGMIFTIKKIGGVGFSTPCSDVRQKKQIKGQICPF